MHNVKNSFQFIEVSVNKEFETDYARNIVKCYLFKTLLQNQKTKQPLSNREIGHMIGCDRYEVAMYLKQMEIYFDRQNNSLLSGNFTDKFNAVNKACIMHINAYRLRSHIAVTESAVNRMKAVLNFNIAQYPN